MISRWGYDAARLVSDVYLPAIGVAALGVERHFLLVANYGLQASHVAVGLITVAIAAVMLWNRLWVATRLAGLCTPGEAIGRYYNSVALRVIFLAGCASYSHCPIRQPALASSITFATGHIWNNPSRDGCGFLPCRWRYRPSSAGGVRCSGAGRKPY